MELDAFHKNTEDDGYSPELDHQFVPMPADMGDGIDYGHISVEVAAATGLSALPVRVSHGEHRGTNNGYGIRHILAAHSEEMSKADYWSVQDFVREVALYFDRMYRDTEDRWLLVISPDLYTPTHRVLVIKLHKSEVCYSVITGYLREAYRPINKTLIWKKNGLGASRPLS